MGCWLIALAAPCRGDGPDAPASVQALERRLEIAVDAAYGGLRVESSGLPITARGIDEADLCAYCPVLVTELGRYSPRALRQAGLRRVVLCRELAYDRQRRNAVPDFEGHCLYLDVLRGAYNRPYLRRVLHHDLYHMLDLADDGELYKDASWSALNPPEFHYGSGGADAQTRSDSSLITDAYPGFLTYYATTGVEEDKAEIFCWLMTDRPRLERHAQRDSVLALKVERIAAQAAALGLLDHPH